MAKAKSNEKPVRDLVFPSNFVTDLPGWEVEHGYVSREELAKRVRIVEELGFHLMLTTTDAADGQVVHFVAIPQMIEPENAE